MPPTAAPARTGERTPAGSSAITGRSLPAPVRERRPALVAFGLVLVVAGALGSALLVHRSGDRVDVLVARHDIAPGARISAQDFGVARVAADGAATVPAGALRNFVGTYATTRIPTDTLVNRTMFMAGDTVPADAGVVGIVVAPEQRPSQALESGDVVRAYLVSADGANTVTGEPAGTVLLEAARVVAAGGSSADADAISLLVPAGGAAGTQEGVDATATLVAAAAAGQVALIRLADTATPSVDLVRD
ncbi:MAG: SAF domain-containing protein [Janthinobacterium lividum]